MKKPRNSYSIAQPKKHHRIHLERSVTTIECKRGNAIYTSYI